MKILIELTGWTGALLVLLAYGLLMTGRLAATATSYRWLNLAGSAGLIVNAAWNGAYPTVFLNVVWLGVTAYSLLREPMA